MQVYKNILVAIDCSEVDQAIVDHVGALALQNSATVHLMHVVHSHTLDQERVLREQTEAAMAVHCAKLRSQGIEVRVVIRSGEPDAEILKEIETAGKEYDLVAMATHGHRIIGDILFGSVSRILKHKITVPLLLLRPGVK